jgi:tetratricopeptide (TPR) repeat protein
MSTRFIPGVRGIVLVLALTVLAACDTAEERAEGHYQKGLELIEAGDTERAIVELRNVFKLNGLHREARLTYAEVMRQTGDFGEAYRHYLLLTEQYPNDPLPRIWLFRIAILGDNFEEAKRHGDRAVEIAPEDPEVQVIEAIIAYQAAADAGESAARMAAAQRVREKSIALGDAKRAYPILVDNHIRNGERDLALEQIEKLLEDNPYQRRWQELKLRLIAQTEDEPRIEEQLVLMTELFPDNNDYAGSMVEWHMERNDADAAEEFLRKRIETASDEEKKDQQTLLISFISRQKGIEAAIAELDRLISDTSDPTTFRSLRAGLMFDSGDRDGAIAELSDLVSGDGDSDELRDIKTSLALMLSATGDQRAARARIDEVLAENPGHVGAIKQHAAWLIQGDEPDLAIVELRTALSNDPDDPAIMTLMAEAHLRNGSRNLAGEMLSLAVEASGNAPGPSLDHVRFLVSDRDFPAAEDVLLDALRVSPGNSALLAALGRIYIETNDWARAEQTEASLRAIGDPESARTADGLRIERLNAQERGEEALRFLENLAETDDGSYGAKVAIARSQMENGNFVEAEAFIERQLAEVPGQPVMRMLLAALYAQTNRAEEAEALFRELVAEDPSREIVWRTLHEMKLRVGDEAGASAVLDEALQAIPGAPDLLWAKAGEYERANDFEGAIGIYEDLYERLPNSPIIANNLASLITTHRDTAEELERAYTIARRLRGSNIAAFQDTYGWIAYLRGDIGEALDHLEPAAGGLPTDPFVHYHLGMAYSAADRYAEAVTTLSKAIELAGPDSSRSEIEKAQAEIDRIEALVAAAEGN